MSILRTADVMGPRENEIHFWILLLWLQAHVPLHMPMHLDETWGKKAANSFTYSVDIGQAVVQTYRKARDEVRQADT